ncbi:hypothetical protein COCNU_03G011160 [Cocos nucifera]|uniref:Uncharacterized protein n=1 Tax=Cocos nucifera TaxID=13894 RepID=A0A8K0I363_COCNU|nr:hypothetical protein COCNU_03G011160 [Cocos nucifera]
MELGGEEKTAIEIGNQGGGADRTVVEFVEMEVEIMNSWVMCWCRGICGDGGGDHELLGDVLVSKMVGIEDGDGG